MKTKFFLYLTFCALCVCGSGCVQNANPCRSAEMTAHNVDLQSFALMYAKFDIGNVSGGEKTDPRGGTPMVGNGGFLGALEKSLAANGLYSRHGKYSVSARILYAGELEMRVRYCVLNKETEQLIFDKIITSRGKEIPRTRKTSRRVLTQREKEQTAKCSIEDFLVALDRMFLEQEKRADATEKK